MILLALLGCLDQLLESPYVLATGLGEVRSVAPTLDGQLIVATSTGVFAVDGGGRVAPHAYDGPAQAVTSFPTGAYLLRDERLTFPDEKLLNPENFHSDWTPFGPMPYPGAVDILAGYDELVVAYRDRLVLQPRQSPDRTIPLPCSDLRAVALGPSPTYLVVTPTRLLSVRDGLSTELAKDLVDARAAATDAKGRVYVAAGDPAELWRVDPGGLTSVAKWLGDVHDLHFGVGGLLPVENLYIANGAGTLDYVRPPP